MDYLELSIKNVKEKSRELYEKIVSEYDYDLVIFIAKGSYLIGKELSELNNVPLLEIFATRKGSKLKKVLSPFLKLIPKTILIKLREKEMNSTYHETNNDRTVSFDENIYSRYKDKNKILLVDDSIDSGNSIVLTKNEVKKYFENADVKVAVFNVMNKATIKPDFCVYKDTMICGPWSNDSKEHKDNLKMYMKWKDSIIEWKKVI